MKINDGAVKEIGLIVATLAMFLTFAIITIITKNKWIMLLVPTIVFFVIMIGIEPWFKRYYEE